jgi:hypothetical protein
MAEERPYSLLIRLGSILLPILAGVLVWAYYHPPAFLARNAPAVVTAPRPASVPNPSELAVQPADPIAGQDASAAPAEMPAPAAAATMPAPAATTATPAPAATTARPPDPDLPGAAALRNSTPVARAPAAQRMPAAPAAPVAAQPPTPGARDIRKQEASSTPGTIEKLDKEIARKLTICEGC